MTYEEFSNLCEYDDTKEFVWLRQENMDIGGGKIGFNNIDRINEFENTDKVMISGLHQDTFDYFIRKYGHRIKYINFFKNKMVEDFSALSELAEVQYIKFFHNQRATKLWNMSTNHMLAGLCFDDFTRLHSIDGIQTAPNLKYFHFGDRIWNTSALTDINPLVGTNLVCFSFGGKSIENKDITIYEKMPALRYLDFATNLYTTEDIAQIVARCPNISGYALKPYIQFDSKNDYTGDVLLCGKRKPFLYSERDKDKIQKHSDKFYALVNDYREQARTE